MRLQPPACFLALVLAGCAAPPPTPETLAVDALLLGEQHDAEDHPQAQEHWVAQLARRGVLAALAVEMAERGTSTEGLPPAVTEAQVRDALRWDAQAWPWERYGPVVMTAVRAGVPVFGANLPHGELRSVQGNEAFDSLLPATVLDAQQQAIRSGHCDLLPEHHVLPLARVQIARDHSMALVVSAAAVPGKTVVLVAGSGHVHPELGVPRHLPARLSVRQLVLPARDTGKDYCEDLRKRFQQVPHPVS